MMLLVSPSLSLLFVAYFAAAAWAQLTSTGYTERRLLDCTLESKTLSQCNVLAYAYRVGVWLAPGIVVGVVLLLACPLYCIFKYCCDCCGGKNQTPNFCCPNKKYPAKYSRGDLLRPKVLAIVIVVGSVGSFAWGYLSTATMATGLDGTTKALESIPGALEGKITAIDALLTVDTYDPDTNTAGTENVFLGSAARNSAVQLKTKFNNLVVNQMGAVKQYMQYASIAGFLLFAIPLVLLIIGMVCAFVNVRNVAPMLIVWLLFLFGALLWCAHGGFSGLSLLIGDVCTEIHGVVNAQANVVAVAISCEDSMFSEFRSNFKDLEVQQASAVCTELSAMCYIATQTPEANIAAGRVYECPTGVVCATMTYATLSELMRTSYKIHNNVANHRTAIDEGKTCATPSNRDSCTVKKCVSDCTLNGAETVTSRKSKSVTVKFAASKTVSQSIDTIGAEYSTCDAVLSDIAAPFDTPCFSLADSLVGMRQSSGIHGLAVLAGIFVMGWGAKRFMPLDQAGKILDDTRPPKDENA
jgi:hypothetical protein